jgi:hypothetical protein
MLNSIVNQKSQIEATQVIGTPVQHSPESPPSPYMPYNSVELILAWTALFRALTILIQSLTTLVKVIANGTCALINAFAKLIKTIFKQGS